MEELKKIKDLIPPLAVVEEEEIPDIDLYMDQVTTFMESKLSSFKRSEDEKILTKTMINNYAKAKLFPPPYKKKYNKNHIKLLILIYHLKSVLSINDIKLLLNDINEELNENSESELLNKVYKGFTETEKRLNQAPLKGISDFEQDGKEKEILAVLTLALFAETQKRLAEKIIDTKFN